MKKFVVKAIINGQIWYHYSNVTRATLLFTLSNGNKVTGKVLFLCLCYGGNVADTIFYASVRGLI
jgi:hypothetical protein